MAMVDAHDGVAWAAGEGLSSTSEDGGDELPCPGGSCGEGLSWSPAIKW